MDSVSSRLPPTITVNASNFTSRHSGSEASTPVTARAAATRRCSSVNAPASPRTMELMSAPVSAGGAGAAAAPPPSAPPPPAAAFSAAFFAALANLRANFSASFFWRDVNSGAPAASVSMVGEKSN